MKNLYMLVGIPGSGKSTFVRNHLTAFDWYVSRDNIRFDLVKEDEPYFSKEKEVLKTYIKEINRGLQLGYDVYADATHCNRWARNNILSKITDKVDNVCAIVMKTSLETALMRNQTRDGRLRVPEDQIRKMYNGFQMPEFEEGFDIIYIVEGGKDIVIKRKV